MSEHLDTYDDADFDDDDDFELGTFGLIMYEAIGPKVKQYLSDHYGDHMLELEAETYVKIEEVIKDGFYFGAVDIPELFYHNRSISNEAFDDLFETYKRTGKTFTWPRPKYWFDRDFNNDDDDDDSYLEDSDPIDLNEQEQMAKKAIEAADNFLNDYAAFANFTKKGYDILSKDVQDFLAYRAPLDLEILTEEGFKQVEESIFWMITELLSDLFGLVNYDLENKN